MIQACAVVKPTRPLPEAITRHKDGRQVCDLKRKEGKDTYFGWLMEMVLRQGQKCAMCLREFGGWLQPTFDHQAGRGMGGAWRDDRIAVEGDWLNAALCIPCQGIKGSKQYRWVDGKYVPKGKR